MHYSPRKSWRISDLLKWGEQYFSNNKFPTPRQEIELLLQETLQCDRFGLYLRFEELLDKAQLTNLREWIKRRLNREPTQYITGKAGFYNLILEVAPDVMIPRPESECSIDAVLDIIPIDAELSIVDIGTGSGCLALAIANERPKISVTGIDISKHAVELAKKNAKKLNIQNVVFFQADFLTSEINETFDIAISNPPYIPKRDIPLLMPEVRKYEPKSALTDFADGLIFYYRMAKECHSFLKRNSWVFLEVGLGSHPKKARELFLNNKFKQAKLIRDYNGDDRVLKVRLT